MIQTHYVYVGNNKVFTITTGAIFLSAVPARREDDLRFKHRKARDGIPIQNITQKIEQRQQRPMPSRVRNEPVLASFAAKKDATLYNELK